MQPTLKIEASANLSARQQKRLTRLPPRAQIKRILVIKLRHFGDVLLTTPLLNSLKLNYPNALLDILLYDGTEAILAGNNDLNQLHTVDRNLKQLGIKQQFLGEKALWQQLNEHHYDLIVNLSDQWRAALYCRWLKPTLSLGFRYAKRDNKLWQSCHSILVDTTAHKEQHTVLNNLSLLAPLNLPIISTNVVMAYSPQDQSHINKLCQYHTLQRYIVIQPTARWAFKTWAANAFSQVIDYLIAHDEHIVITGGKSADEQQLITSILSGCKQPERIINLAGKLELTELAALIDHAVLFIGVDSVPMHMAAALQTPSVVLFGPTNLKQWHPWQAPHSLLWAGDYCQLPTPEQVDTNTRERYLDAIPVAAVIDEIAHWISP